MGLINDSAHVGKILDQSADDNQRNEIGHIRNRLDKFIIPYFLDLKSKYNGDQKLKKKRENA